MNAGSIGPVDILSRQQPNVPLNEPVLFTVTLYLICELLHALGIFIRNILKPFLVSP